jgi:penicillin-binding protein 1A
MVDAYGCFPSDGVLHEMRSYLSLYDHSGKLVMENKTNKKRVFKESTARIMNNLLMNVTESGTASSITLKNMVDTAGKTGTSSANRDKLFIGYTPSYVAGIWCGYDNGSEIRSMSKSHLKIWDEIMNEIYDDTHEREVFSTEGLMQLPYCKDSGRAYSDVCIYDPRGSRMEYGYFSADNVPTGKCDRHVVLMYDSLTKAVACHGCPNENLVPVSLIYHTDRAFPKQITITDAEYVCRDIGRYDTRPIDYALPYFEYTIPDGVFVGRSKNKKQFNSNCYLHDD